MPLTRHPPNSHTGRFGSLWLGTALALLGAALVWTRWHTVDEAIDTDVANFAVIARGLLQGRELYSDLFDLKPPLIYGLFAVAQLITTSGPAQLFVLSCTFGLITLAGVYRAGVALNGRPTGGLIAGFIYVLINNNVQTWSSQVFAEYIEAAGLVWMLALGLRLLRNPTNTRCAISLGTIMAGTTFIKHPVIVYWFMTAPALVLLADRSQRRVMLRQTAIATAVIATAWTITLLYFALQSRLRDLWDALVTMNGYNAGQWVGSNLAVLFSRQWLDFYLQHTLLLAPAACVVVGALIGARSSHRREWLFLLGTLAAIGVVVTLPIRPYDYYLHLWLPFLAVGCGWAWHALTDWRPRGNLLANLAISAVVAALLWVQWPWFAQPADAWSQHRRGPILNETRQLGLQITRFLRPGETFYMWGGETGLYFSSERVPPTGFINIDSVEAGPIAARLSQRLEAQLIAHPPEMLVLLLTKPRIPVDSECTKVWRWLLEHYGIMPEHGLQGSYLLCCRIGGELERRTSPVAPLASQLRVQTADGKNLPAK